MKKRLCATLLAMSVMASAMPVFAAPAASTAKEAVYLGVEDYGTVTNDQKPEFQHKFSIDGKVVSYLVESDGEAYTLQNKLQEGYIYDITVNKDLVTAVERKDGDAAGEVEEIEDDEITVEDEEFELAEDVTVQEIVSKAGGAVVTDKTLADVDEDDTVRVFVNDQNEVDRIYLTFVADEYESPVAGVPGLKTVKNFLATAMEPVGTALYIYGGTWDWQDVGSSNQATSIGVAQSWVDFFQSQDQNFTYKYSDDHSASYYPHEAWNQYYYAGIDCSGYVGWAVYNLMNTQDGQKGYVCSATKMAQRFANEEKWGTMDYGTLVDGEDPYREFTKSEFKPGDIFSMNGHVWISLGQCDDGSVVILHSTPSDSRTGAPGGGVQISGVGKSKDCEAYRLADFYMAKYFPQWDSRYDAVCRNFDDYTEVSGDRAGKFSWDMEKVMSDPDGYMDMTPAEILADLFRDCDDDLPFTDVHEDDWFEDAVEDVYEAGIMVGVSDTLFAPHAKMTRAQMAQILYSAAGKPAVKFAPKFSDVEPGAWYADAVGFVASKGLMAGIGGGKMGPDLQLTREQLAMILYRCAALSGEHDMDDLDDLDGYRDVNQISPWALVAMSWAVEEDLMDGYSETQLAPKGIVTRAEAAQMMANFLDLD